MSVEKVRIELDGAGRGVIALGDKDISQKVQSLNFYADGTGPPVLEIEYACYEQTTLDGEMEVVHVCPKKAREK